MTMRCRHKRRGDGREKSGVSLVEVLIAIGIIGILLGMLMPAAQSVRESARNTACKNHLRQLVTAAQHFEGATGYLPGPWFNAPPDSQEYGLDRGLFVGLLSYIGEANRDDDICNHGTTFDIDNASLLTSPIDLLACPSSNHDPVILTDIATLFSGPSIPGMTAVTCDYIGNGGYASPLPIDPSHTDGPIGAQIPGSNVPKETMARTSDGLSNTLLFWESIGGSIIPGLDGVELDVNLAASPAFVLSIYGPPAVSYPSSGIASTKSYIHSWAGLRLGNMRETAGRVVGVGNSIGQPCSRHLAGANAALVDGSIRLLSRDLAPNVGLALASLRGAEVVDR